MMPQARSKQISLIDTPYYHCVSRCVRRAFLCGVDKATGKSYEHRRSWVEQRLLKLGQVFSIDICAYAVMSNHTHIVLHVDATLAKSWSMKEVIERWHKLYSGTLFTQQYLNGEKLDVPAIESVKSITEVYRQRLMNISWFMRALNEPIARKANDEDDCTGRFWEGRFKSQALLDETALIACMAYVDLNPVRAGISSTPESSLYTSIKQRVKSAIKGEQPKRLLSFIGNSSDIKVKGIPFLISDYLLLVNITSRTLKEVDVIKINTKSNNILQQLNINFNKWQTLTHQFESIFKGAVGSEDAIDKYCENQQFKRRQGISNIKKWFGR